MPPKSSLVLGLMSGTSADAIDVALARISGAPPKLNAKLLNHTSVNFLPQLRKEILRVAERPLTLLQSGQIQCGDLEDLSGSLAVAGGDDRRLNV